MSRKKPVEKVVPMEKPTKAIKITLHQEDKELDDLVLKVHHETMEEEAKEEPTEILQRQPRKHVTKQ